MCCIVFIKSIIFTWEGLWWFLQYDIYNYNSELFLVKASKFLRNFFFLIILCQQFFKGFIYFSCWWVFHLNIRICKSFFEVNQYLHHSQYYEKYKLFDLTKFISVLPMFWQIQQSSSRTSYWLTWLLYSLYKSE